MNVKRLIILVLIIIWMSIVFFFSSEKSEDSNQRSYNITEEIVEVFNKDINEADKKLKTNNLQHYIRKLAHFTLYTIGGVLFFLFANTYDISLKKKSVFSFSAGMLFACSDELHQLFVSGRSGQPSDVVIDSLGVILGIFFIIFVLKAHKLSKKWKKSID